MDDKTIPIKRIAYPPEKDAPELNQAWDDNLSYRALFEQTGECIFIISLDFHYITANLQALNLLGYEESELAGMPVDEVVSQDELPDDERNQDQASQLQERVLKCKDGSGVPVEISTTIVYGDNDEPAYIQSVARDISIRKNTERTLKRNALILSIISEAAARLLQSSDIDAKIPALLESLGRAMNISCCAIFAVNSFSEPKKADIRFIWNASAYSDPYIATFIDRSISQLLESDTPVFSPRTDKDNKRDASNLSYLSFAMEGAFGAKGYLGFIDEAGNLSWSQPEMDALQTAANLINAALQRKRFEETLRMSEIRNRIIVDALPDLIIRVGLNGTILDFSANPSHPLYLHRDLAYGRKLDNTFPEEIASRILGDENQEAFVSPQKVEEFRLPYAKGTYESNLYPISPEEALIVIRDVTEQVELNEMKSDFINRASHELRTPLTSAMLMVELIQEGGTPDEVEECWRTLKAELQRQKELIDRLLMAGRLESGMMKIEVRTIDLLPIIRESMQSVQSLVTRRDITLALTCDQEAYLVQGDKGALQQVFVNLIINAAKFSPEGSQVEIHISHNQTHVNCAIVDKGIGIPQEDLPHLFERFYRAKNVTIAEIPGSGIGLYIVNSIVKELGGEITVDSIPEKGTTFTVCLRRADSEGAMP
jgi:PAS domain S-box-containing protein